MFNRYEDYNTSYVLEKLAKANPKEIDAFIKECCEEDNDSYIRNIVSILGNIKFQTIIESNLEILKQCLDKKNYKSFESIFIETDLSKEIIASMFLHHPPPLEISILLNHLDFKDKFIKAVEWKQINQLKKLIYSDNFKKYPRATSLIEKSIMKMFSSYSENLEILKYFISEKNLENFKELILKQALNLAIFTNKEEIIKYIIIDLNLEKTNDILAILELDKSKFATSLFNSRDLNHILEKKLAEKTSEKREGSTKI